MYSPTTRILTVLELLQSYPRLSGAELADKLEVDIRSIRRYVQRLQEMGLPIVGEAGPAGGYHMGRGYKMPPLILTDQESVALTLGLMLLRDMGNFLDPSAIIGALAKTERVMPVQLHAQAQDLQMAIRFHLRLYQQPVELRYITDLSQAIRAECRVHLGYEARDGQVSERAFEPYGIIMNEGIWYTVGWCCLRQALRTFRVDRFQSLSLTDQTFKKPEAFDALDHVLTNLAQGAGEDEVEVLLLTTLEIAQQACPPTFARLEATSEGVLLRRGAYHLDWVAYGLMQLDFPMQVRKPLALRELLLKQGQKALAMVDTSQTRISP
ncbi:MAG: YafY family transcriptional regulator [Candidatus Sericytochromatia bacterium]|nr:YafY family transcriptional regulator [Candidatus Sericytochromatia bacterium]